jgi:hypothetical protein
LLVSPPFLSAVVFFKGVDAMTYLFNLCAERFKNAPFSSQELQLSLEERQHKQKMKRHYLELIPPLLSVCTLLAVTIATMRDALHTLLEDEVDNIAGDDEKIGVMLLFSSLNLLLDVVNVTCFARADQAFGLMAIPSQNEFRESIRRASDDLSHLMHSKIPVVSHAEESNGIELHALSMDEATNNEESLDLVNLNMCSAWTVRAPPCLVMYNDMPLRFSLVCLHFAARLCGYIAQHCSVGCCGHFILV